MTTTDELPTLGPTRRHRPVRPRVPVFLQVVLAVFAFVIVLVALVAAPRQSVTPSSRTVVGVEELVRLTGPTGTNIEVLARIDTGASSSSIDTNLAKSLGFDLENADRVAVASSLGRERRPVVNVAMQLAGTVVPARMNVNDRTRRSNLVLLGRDDLRSFHVAVGDRLLTSPGDTRAPRALQVLLAQAPALGPTELLAILPLAALFIVVLRVVVGLATLGTFSPVLLALGYTQAGLTLGLMLTAAMFAFGFVAEPLLRRFRLPRVARLATLIGVVTVGLLTVQELAGLSGASDSWGAALPVVVTAVTLERMWETWDTEGVLTAKEGLITLAVAVVATLMMVTPFARALVERSPLQLALVCTALAFLVGSYRGLRLLEIRRFRRAARALPHSEGPI